MIHLRQTNETRIRISFSPSAPSKANAIIYLSPRHPVPDTALDIHILLDISNQVLRIYILQLHLFFRPQIILHSAPDSTITCMSHTRANTNSARVHMLTCA